MSFEHIIAIFFVVVILGVAGILFLLFREKKLALPVEWKLPEFTLPNQFPWASPLPQDLVTFLNTTPLKDVMSKKVVSINIQTSFVEVPHKMNEYSIRHLPVVDDDNKVVGMITERLLYKIRSPRKLMDGEWYYDEEMLNDIILKHVMLPDPYTLQPEHSLGKALVKMVYAKIGSIPVVDKNNVLLGIVTRNDVLRRIAEIYSAGSYSQKEKEGAK